MDDKKFTEQLIKLLVENPKDVKVDRLVNDRGVLLTIDINPEDIGGIIGKQGRNIDAIRHLVRMIGLQNKSFVSLRLNQPEDATK